MRKRIVSLFLAFLMGFAETAAASPVAWESPVGNEDKTGGFFTIGDGFVPDKAVEEGRMAGSLNLLGKSENSKYFPIGEDYIPQTLEDQNGSELCWAISQAYACEINAKKKGLIEKDRSLSASHLGFFCYNLGKNVADPEGNTKGEYTRALGYEDWAEAPGNGRLSMWAAASWIGFVGYDRSTDETYNLSQCLSAGISERAGLFPNDTEEAYLRDDIHVTDVSLAGVDSERREDVKELIMGLGAVTGGYYSNRAYDSFAQKKEADDGYEVFYGNYYYDGAGNKSPNHAITIIGWDDDYPKENFVKQPSSDGAWLCMNSWGEENDTLAQDGFFWLSYEDAGLQREGTVIGYSVEKARDQQHIYQYDGSLGIETTRGDCFMQFFQLNRSERITSVSVGIGTAGADCTASLYKISGDLNAHYQDTSWVSLLKGQSGTVALGEDFSATYLGSTQASFSYEGYHTIDVSDLDASGKEGSVIAVVMEFDDQVELYTDRAGTIQNVWKFVTSDDPYHGISSDRGNASVLGEGESLRIKMFTEDYEEELTPTVPEVHNYHNTYGWSDTEVKNFLESLKDTGSATFSINGVKYTIVRNPDGTYSITFMQTNNGGTMTIPSEIRIGDTIYPMTTIADNAFRGNTTIKTIVIDNGITTIGNYAFYGCTALETVSMANTVLKVGKYAFAKCPKLKKVTASANCYEMGKGVFSDDGALTGIKLGNKLTKIPVQAFKNCKKLKSIKITKSVTEIGKQAFYGCKKLKTVTFKTTLLKKVGSKAFKKCKKGIKFKVSKKKKESYKKLLKGKY